MPYTFTVRTPPETGWEVVETWDGLGGHEKVVFSGYAEYQAHCVAQVLVQYVEHERPPEPMQERYIARVPRRPGSAVAPPPRRWLELVKGGAP